jgi:hypothetical protein
MSVSGIEDYIQESLKSGNIKRALQQSGVLTNQLESDKRLLGVKGYEGYGNLHGDATDKRGFNKEEIRAEFAMLIESQRKVTQMFKSDTAGRNFKGEKTTAGKDTTTGTGTTIEAGTPKNLYITVNGGVGTNTVIQSVDGDIPVSKIKELVGRAWLELVNDSYLAMR